MAHIQGDSSSRVQNFKGSTFLKGAAVWRHAFQKHSNCISVANIMEKPWSIYRVIHGEGAKLQGFNFP